MRRETDEKKARIIYWHFGGKSMCKAIPPNSSTFLPLSLSIQYSVFPAFPYLTFVPKSLHHVTLWTLWKKMLCFCNFQTSRPDKNNLRTNSWPVVHKCITNYCCNLAISSWPCPRYHSMILIKLEGWWYLIHMWWFLDLLVWVNQISRANLWILL